MGGKSSRAPTPYVPTEGDNTLQSRATVRVVDLLCEGEIEGLVNGLKSVYIDGVAVQGAGGETQIPGVAVRMRVGTPDQSPISFVSGVEDDAAVDQQLLYQQAIVRTIASNTADAARVTLRFPRLVKQNDKGDTGPASVRFRIERKPSGGVWKTVVAQTIRDKNIAPAELSWRFDLSGSAPHSIRVTRLTEDSDSDRLHNTLWWQRLTAITQIRQSYPYSAVIGLQARAEKVRNQFARREYDIKGTIVQVPSNYDPAARSYTGLWDGTFKRAWSDNPAWVVYDLITTRRYGLGRYVDGAYSSSAKWELYAVAQFCDQLVPNGRGGTEPRFTFNGVINTHQEAKRVIDHVLGNCRGQMYYGAGVIVPVQDRPEDPAALVTNANVVDGDFTYRDLPFSERYSAVAVSFNDPKDGYQLGIELVVDDDLVAKYGYRQTDKAAMFCTSRSQAHRVGRHLLHAQENESDQLGYRAGLDHARIRPGSVIAQSDEGAIGGRHAFRIVQVNGTVITADDLSDVDTTKTWSLVLGSDPDRKIAVQTIQGNAITLSKHVQDSNTGMVAALVSADLKLQQWRVRAVTERDSLTFEVAATRYDSGKYAAVESGTTIQPTEILQIPTGPLTAPSQTAIEQYLYQDGVVTKVGLAITVESNVDDPRAEYTEVELKLPDEDEYDPLHIASRRSFDVRDVRIGSYQARARFVTAGGGLVSGWTESAVYAATGKTDLPTTPANFRATANGAGVLLEIDEITDFDRAGYSFYAGAVFADAALISRQVATVVLYTGAETTFWAVSHDNAGNTSEPATVALAIDPPDAPDVTQSAYVTGSQQISLLAIAGNPGGLPIDRHEVTKADTSAVVATVSGRTGQATLVHKLVNASPGDPHFNDVELLLHANNSLIDSSSHARVVTQSGGVGYSATAKWGSHAFSFDGVDDRLLVDGFPAIGTRDFVIEFWIWPTANGDTDRWARFMTIGTNRQDGELVIDRHTNSNPMRIGGHVWSDAVRNYQNVIVHSSDTELLAEQWSHVCVQRTGNVWDVYINGTRVASPVVASAIDLQGTRIHIGGSSVGGLYVDALYDDVRITVGRARYSGESITVPDGPFADQVSVSASTEYAVSSVDTGGQRGAAAGVTIEHGLSS